MPFPWPGGLRTDYGVWVRSKSLLTQHFLYFLPLPQKHGSFRCNLGLTYSTVSGFSLRSRSERSSGWSGFMPIINRQSFRMHSILARSSVSWSCTFKMIGFSLLPKRSHIYNLSINPCKGKWHDAVAADPQHHFYPISQLNSKSISLLAQSIFTIVSSHQNSSSKPS